MYKISTLEASYSMEYWTYFNTSIWVIEAIQNSIELIYLKNIFGILEHWKSNIVFTNLDTPDRE